MAPNKRKRDIMDFDPNKSDSEDENFEPGEDQPRRSKKKSRSTKGKITGSQRTHNRYNGSDIDDDDDDVSDSQVEGSFGGAGRESEEEEEEEEEQDQPTNATGRRIRKAARKHQSYRESSDDAESVVGNSNSDDDELELLPKPAAAKRPSRVITLKTRGLGNRTGQKAPAAAAVATRRATRAHTEEADEFLELSNSGKHAQPATSSRSKSPEALAQNTRSTRGTKGLKKPPSTIEEATQESSLRNDPDLDELVGGLDGVSDVPMESAEVEQDVKVDEPGGDEEAAAEGDHNADHDDHLVDDDDEDDGPITRRTRASRTTAANEAAPEEADDESEKDNGGRRLTRGSLQKKKSTQEPSSDFEPNEESGEDENFGSDTSPKKGNAESDEDFSSPTTRGRKSSQRRGTKRRGAQESEDELVFNDEEMAAEIQELRESSHSRPRRRVRSPSIVYEQLPKRRRVTKPVDYSIKPLDQLVDQDEEEDPAPTPVRRRNARAGASAVWQRNLLSTFGPFGGGGGGGSLLGGPWGTGATGGVESDSSDDEGVHRPGVGGNIGMTPTSGAAPPGFAAPINLEALTGTAATPNVGKVKNQKAFADADPLGVDLSVDFSKVGGLQGHINQLKEMVTLPLLYPELFLRFKVTPPRGVLFHGPPGTGKTLLARALANSVGVGGRKITFYMRKGADALSKWVGEAEKQLRLLFEEARRTQPSIIFFDEIDGLAPVRSSKQEQIHASIVSTLLALMDGMDGRGQVIVIGATNRPDNIDPALRRPGRFDREFYFPLPDVEGRRSIIDINTKEWGLSDEFKDTLAENTKGYGGADLRALCTESALNAIQRTYPQIYSAQDKLIVEPEKINIHAADFMISMKKMIPSSERSASSGATPLPKSIEPLLRAQYASTVKLLNDILPRKKKTTALEEAMFEIPDDADHGFGKENLNQEFEKSRIFRPRLLITGLPGMGQGYLSSAILHHFEGVHVQSFDLPSLLGDGRPLEQVIVGLFVEVKRHKPAVVYIPDINAWHDTLAGPAYTTFVTMMRSIPPTDPVLLLATAECEAKDIQPEVLKDLFGFSRKNRTVITRPNRESRLEYFTNVISHIRKSPNDFPDPADRKRRVLEELPVAPPPPTKPKTRAEIKEELKRDHLMLNLLKVQLQPIMDQMKKYKKFRQAIIPDNQIQYLWQEADPSYIRPDLAEALLRPFEIAKDREGTDGLRETATGKFFYNLDLATIEERLSNGYYARPKDFFRDIQSLAKDSRNIGDKERVLKANELVSNVEVDVAEVEARLAQGDWEGLHNRQMQRAREAAEKARKRKAAQSMVDLIQSDVQDSDSQNLVGPVTIGETVPGTTSARFRLMSPQSNALGGEAAQPPPLSNGNSVPSRANGEDTQMGGVDEDLTQPFSQMGPPSQWPRADPRSLDHSTRATAGNTQISQVSAVTTIPPGVSPSAIINDASTTKTSDPSTNRSSGPWSAQATNGYHSDAGEHNSSQLPDTQPMEGSGPSQATSSDGQWPHSQAQGIARGVIQPRMGFGGGRSEQSSPTSPHFSKLSKSEGGAVHEGGDTSHSSSLRNSTSTSSSQQQQTIVPETYVHNFLLELTERTSGCTIEQLEQISRELMDEIWRTRSEWNRSRVLSGLSKVFNDTISDIEELQGVLPQSQVAGDDDDADQYARFGVA